MGTIAARDCIRVLELTEQVVAATLIAVVQGVELRNNSSVLSDQLQKTRVQVRENVDFLGVDREMDQDLRMCIQLIRERYWHLYE